MGDPLCLFLRYREAAVKLGFDLLHDFTGLVLLGRLVLDVSRLGAFDCSLIFLNGIGDGLGISRDSFWRGHNYGGEWFNYLQGPL